MSFEDLGLHPKVLKAVAEAGYTKPTTIQVKAISKIVRGFDIRASAQTGTGKTGAFLLPALTRLVESKNKGRGPRLLILAPARELAMQIATQVVKYSKYLNGMKSVCIYGGAPYPPQTRQLSRPYDVLIATPGRLIDFINRRKIDLSGLEILVLDEADRMLDQGFLEPVEQIASKTPDSRQTLLFSATLSPEIIKLSESLLTKPMEIVVRPDRDQHENILQKLHYVDDLHHKNRLLQHILSEDGVDNAIIFTSTKRHAGQLADELKEKGHQAAALHGDMNQRQRTRTIGLLRSGKIKTLVATDVAARGIDVQSITHVINFDLPQSVEDYVHRIGRTGRAGATGSAFTFVAGRDAIQMKKIEKYIAKQIDVVEVAGLEPRPRKKFTPKPSRGGGYKKKSGGFKSGGPKKRFSPKGNASKNRNFRPRSK